MKLNAALAKSLLMAASVGMVVPVLADVTVVKTNPDSTTPPPSTPADTTKPTVTKPAPTKPAPAKPVATKPGTTTSSTSAKTTDAKTTGTAKPGTTAAAAKKEAPTPELPGVVQPRPSGGFLTVEVDGGKFKISFYDKDKKVIPADVARGTARWDTHKKAHADRTVLNPSDDGTLRGAEFVTPPYTFILFVTLINADGNAVENYSIQMHP